MTTSFIMHYLKDRIYHSHQAIHNVKRGIVTMPWKMIYRNAPSLIFILVCGFIFFIFYTADDQSPNGHRPNHVNNHLLPRNRQLLLNNKTQLKTILYWNEFYGRYDTYDFGFGHEAFVEKNCAFSNCFATKDRNLLPSIDMYDAIIIHIRGLPNDWPLKRSQAQRYIMLSIDAPIKLYEYRHLEKLAFNWTMTYRLDSDFPVPYAWIDRVLPLPAPQGSTLLQRFIASHGKKAVTQGPNLAENKVGLAVQFVSNCHSSSKREAYVRELRRFIPVDIYGKCGEFKCAKEKGWQCYQEAEAKYKFYLAFENAVCRDYVTEQFFNMHNLNMIPVVLGGANYSAIAPPHSFIDAADFPNPKALAHYLKLLDADDAKFNEYFWWRDFYARRFRHHQSLCDVCERLHTDKSTKIYDNMQDWWVTQAQCSSNHIISQDDMI
eukprot:07513.XXX_139120_130865_1 [CDS] Oithona nana genome sequencing.